MAKRSAFRGGDETGAVTFNATPMIDCVFQLILFFLLTTQVASRTRPLMKLPKPLEAQAISEKMKTPHRVVINVLSDRDEKNPDPVKAGRAKEFLVGTKTIPAHRLDKLEKIVREEWEKTDPEYKKDFFVEIRADRDVHYAEVARVMEKAARVGIVKMHLTTFVEPKEMR